MTEPRIPLERGLDELLRPAPAPADLRSRLLRDARRVDRPRRRMRYLVLAASLLAALGLSWAVLVRPQDPAMDLVRAAARRHHAEPALEFRGMPASESDCGSWCQKRLGYAATLPHSVQPSEVVGGSVASLKTHPVAYYRLKCGDGLFVFEHAPRELARPRGFQVGKRDSALSWTEGERSYLRVSCCPE